jgi:hypothetical protein
VKKLDLVINGINTLSNFEKIFAPNLSLGKSPDKKII